MIWKLLAGALAACLAAAGPAAAKPKGCFSAGEARAEGLIRHSVRLREGAWRCDKMGYTTGAYARWQDLAAQFAEPMAAEVEKRARAFGREFEAEAAARMRTVDARDLQYFRYRPLTQSYCRHLDGMLAEIGRGGWGALRRQAASERTEVGAEYRRCD